MDGTPAPGARAATNWKLTLCYDGTPYDGWQVQPGRRTVQAALAEAIRRVTGQATLPQGSGRTDAGVHALGQVASVRLLCPIPAQNLMRALNHALPRSIRILDTQAVPDLFHARHSAGSKTYEYRVWRPAYCPPWMAPYVYPFDYRMDLGALEAAAAHVVGTHDFRSFQAQQPDIAARGDLAARGDMAARETGAPRTTVRTIFSSAWEQPSPELLVYRVRGSGFLHHMVRNLVGTFLVAGRGLIAVDALPSILAARERIAAGPTAPACGLWLHSVEYPERVLG